MPVSQVLHRQPLGEVLEEFSDEEVDFMCDELSDALKQIYSEFVSDFTVRRNKRINSEIPLEQVQDCRLVVESKYRRLYAAKVNCLISAGYGNDAISHLQDNILGFVKSMREQVLEVRDPMLRLKVLEDAYRTMQNASEEVGKIVKSLFLYDKAANYESFNKQHFYEQVVKEVKNSLQDVAEAYTNSSDCDFELLYGEPQLYFSELQDYKGLEPPSTSDSDEENSVQAELGQMSIDELITYIEDSPASRSKKKRGKAASSSSSPAKENVGDSEFEALLASLKSVKPAANKVKPNLKPEWLQSLRSRRLQEGIRN
jgi:hypothetical protein